MTQKNKNTFIFVIIAFIIFFLAACYITYPLIFHLGNLVTGYGDELVIAWIQNWVMHSLSTNPFTLFEANLYYPYHNTLAYSDLHLTSSILAFLPTRLIGEPIVSFNFTVISSIVLVGFSLFLLCFSITRDYFASLLSGILVIFSPAFLDKKVHVQVLALEWIPLSILCFLLFMKRKQIRYFVMSMVFSLLQTYNSFMPGYFLLFFFLIYIVYYWFTDRRSIRHIFNKANLVIVAITFALLIPIVIPYYQVSREFQYVRDIRDSIHFALQPEDLIYATEHTRLAPILMTLSNAKKYPRNAEIHSGYLGFTFSILSIITSVAFFTRMTVKQRPLFTIFMLTALTGLVLSFGPLLHLNRVTIHKPFPIPLPYGLFYYIAPGFQGFRNSARWEMLFLLCMTVAVALLLTHSLRKLPHLTRLGVYIVLVLAVILEYSYPMKFMSATPKSSFPAVYSWLNTTPAKSAAIFMPIYNWNTPGADEIQREYYSTVNFRPLVNGYTGFSPPPWQKLIATLRNTLPDKEGIKTIRNLGVNYIIVDKEQYDKGFKAKYETVDGRFVINSIKKNSSLKFIKNLNNYYLFKFIN